MRVAELNNLVERPRRDGDVTSLNPLENNE
jgi:hypothetical protein